MRPFDPQEGERALATHPHQVRLAGPLAALRFPALCASCGAGASERVPVPKVFMRSDSSGPRRFAIARVEVPFCPGCTARHHQQAPPITAGQKLLSLLRTEMVLPTLGLGALALFFAAQMSGRIAQDPAGSWPLAAGLAGLFALALLCLKTAWENGERFRVPAPSEVTTSFDYGDDLSNTFGTHGRLYAIRDAGFAKEFQALNQVASDALQGPQEKRRTNRNFVIGLVLLAAVVLYGVLKDLLGG